MHSNQYIDTTQLGTGGPLVGVQGLGAMGMTSYYGDSDPELSRQTLASALDHGVTLFDTADFYSFGKNEEFIAPFVQANRNDITIATKFGYAMGLNGEVVIRNDRAHIRAAVDASLQRLGIDVIDVYYMHRRNPEVPLAESVGAMSELVQEGKVRYLGLSEVSGTELREAHAIHSIAAVEQEWSLFNRQVEDTTVPVAAELGVALVPYSPLGRGFLTGKVDFSDKSGPNEARGSFAQYSGDNAARNAALLQPVHDIAAQRGVSTAQIALAWVQQRSLVHGLPVVPIPGTRKPERLLENLAATRLVLDDSELQLLEPISSQVAGDRYPDMTKLM
ncbi:aldo/keto reductase [Rhodococcus erythropolis]|uniref:aldo/keto reductase n=1 Tax=Rhodococcus erythropolis TaxID=1833 RepID=UPI00222751D2|nr:aldo/keto reductase [Rhodococcus erythropolis]MCW2295460.1 aryl-alcohol dehydrogenase-like predicted oxidoreductase [Rhodococcus erythropolis]